jgi:hypothetical protein
MIDINSRLTEVLKYGNSVHANKFQIKNKRIHDMNSMCEILNWELNKSFMEFDGKIVDNFESLD